MSNQSALTLAPCACPSTRLKFLQVFLHVLELKLSWTLALNFSEAQMPVTLTSG